MKKKTWKNGIEKNEGRRLKRNFPWTSGAELKTFLHLLLSLNEKLSELLKKMNYEL